MYSFFRTYIIHSSPSSLLSFLHTYNVIQINYCRERASREKKISKFTSQWILPSKAIFSSLLFTRISLMETKNAKFTSISLISKYDRTSKLIKILMRVARIHGTFTRWFTTTVKEKNYAAFNTTLQGPKYYRNPFYRIGQLGTRTIRSCFRR